MLRPMRIDPVPPDIARVARAAFPRGHRHLGLADELNTLFTDEAFLALFSRHGQPAWLPWRLALVTMLQFAEGLSDRQAAHAVRSHLDWKYVLRLELTDPSFDVSVLSAFRTRLITGAAHSLLLDTLLTWCRDHRPCGAARTGRGPSRRAPFGGARARANPHRGRRYRHRRGACAARAAPGCVARWHPGACR
jgi:transposase